MAAGHETTANTLSWALFELTRHPDIQDKLRAEIRQRIAEKGNNVFSGHDYENMPYLTAVVKVSQTFPPFARDLDLILLLHCTGNAPSLSRGLHFNQAGSCGRCRAALETGHVDKRQDSERASDSEGTEGYSFSLGIQQVGFQLSVGPRVGFYVLTTFFTRFVISLLGTKRYSDPSQTFSDRKDGSREPRRASTSAFSPICASHVARPCNGGEPCNLILLLNFFFLSEG
jgi:hypothetical protein